MLSAQKASLEAAAQVAAKATADPTTDELQQGQAACRHDDPPRGADQAMLNGEAAQQSLAGAVQNAAADLSGTLQSHASSDQVQVHCIMLCVTMHHVVRV